MKSQKSLGLDDNGIQKVMRRKDYAADMLGQLGLAVMSNIVAQLTYFYTDKVGVAVGAVGIVMALAKVADALTDVFVGNIIDNSKGDSRKYYRWMIRIAIPAAITIVLLFTVPIKAGQTAALIYVLITNILLTAVFYTMIAIPFTSVQIVRTESPYERTRMGVFRAIGSYIAGITITMLTIPITNALGGTQSAWIKYGVLLGIAVLACLLVCYMNGRNAVMFVDSEEGENQEEQVSLKEAIGLLIRNKYWVMVLLYNLIVGIIGSISGTSAAYYCKWIFGNDNLVAIAGGVGMVGTLIGFLISQPMIRKFGVRNTILIGLGSSALFSLVRCFTPTSMVMYMVTGALGGCAQIPLMCLYGVIAGFSVDYNEYKYGKRMVAVSSGAVSFGAKVGIGLASVILSACLAISGYDATLSAATPSMRMGIYAFANYIPIVLNVAMLVLFLGFDIEEKLPAMRAEIEARQKRENEEDPL